jgi:hypothetical protein
LDEEDEGLAVLPREEKAARRRWRSRPPPAAGIGSAAATMGKVAAIQARHRRDWSGGPSPVPMQYEAAEQAAMRGPVRAAATRRGGGADVFVLWSVEEGIAANTGERRHANFGFPLLPVAGRF